MTNRPPRHARSAGWLIDGKISAEPVCVLLRQPHFVI
jgi:hypothetical protein